MQDLIALWHQHWDSIVHYAGLIVPWAVEVKLRLLGILLSWPAVTLYLGLLFMFMFRIPLATLIDRIVRFKAMGIEAEMPISDQRVVPRDEPQRPPTPAPSAAAVEAYWRNIQNELSKRLFFERALNTIFGSQLALLRALATAPSRTVSFGAVALHFATHQRLIAPLIAAGAPPPTIPIWAHWLVEMDFVAYDPQSMDFRLLNGGAAFVQYVNENYGVSGPWRNG